MNIRIEWTYLHPKKTESTLFSSEWMTIEAAMAIANDLEKLGRIKSLTFFDEHDSTWTMKELKRYLQSLEDEPHELIAYFDGGFDIQEKTAGLGAVIYYKQSGKRYRLRHNRKIDLIGSNNEAEYAALMLVLEQIEQLNVTHQSVKIYGDSLVVINQMNDEWPCYEEDLLAWIGRIEQKAKELGLTLIFESISRKDNREADQLASQALQGVEIDSKLEI